MAFSRRRKRKYRWIQGSVAGDAATNVAAGTVANVVLVGPTDIVEAGIAGDRAIVRRVVGTAWMDGQVSPSIAVSSFAQGLVRAPLTAAGAAVPVIVNATDFEDQRWLTRRDFFANVGWSSSISLEDIPGQLIDWRGACELIENRTNLYWTGYCSLAWRYWLRLRVLLEEPSGR